MRNQICDYFLFICCIRFYLELLTAVILCSKREIPVLHAANLTKYNQMLIRLGKCIATTRTNLTLLIILVRLIAVHAAKLTFHSRTVLYTQKLEVLIQ